MSILLALALQAAAIPSAVIADPPRDAVNPARNEQLLIPSHGAGMNALLFHAAGAGPKPLVVLLHGLPGNERNLDLAQAIRRAGWSVLTFSYRGAFGSGGRFSIANAAEDADAAMAFLRAPGTAARHGIDPRRIVIGGHSMGAFAALLHARADPDLAGLVLLDVGNIGKFGAESRAKRVPAATLAEGFDDLGHILSGATAETLAAEVLSAPPHWVMRNDVAGLKAIPLLAVGASEGGGADTREVADAVRAAGNKRVTAMTLTTDHSFADHRIALAGAIVDWLGGLGR